MDLKEIQSRLEIIKIATHINDTDTIVLQTAHLKKANDAKIDEIIELLSGRNFRQALYLIKTYNSESGYSSISEIEDSETEKVLDIEDMLRMSPLAKETIREYKSSKYTQDDLEAFAKNIDTPVSEAYNLNDKNQEDSYAKTFENIQNKQVESTKEKLEVKDDNIEPSHDELAKNHKDTPLDEMKIEPKKEETKQNRTQVLSKYKTLREKFAKKDKKDTLEKKETLSKSSIAQSVLDKAKNIGEKFKNEDASKELEKSKQEPAKKEPLKTDVKKSEFVKKVDKTPKKAAKKIDKEPKKEDKQVAKSSSENNIYPPIPHIEQKFRQAFVLYPPNKESEVWVEVVIKFLKTLSLNSYTDKDVKEFLNEYKFYLDKGDIAKASQVLLLAAATDSKYAQFILARELFNGRVLRRDLKKSYAIMKNLANSFYPDAICDLAQFYEYGIGVPKDKKVAIKLYEKAFELGVDRATKHINRIKESGGIFSSLLKLK